jgi:hypothetical protein
MAGLAQNGDSLRADQAGAADDDDDSRVRSRDMLDICYRFSWRKADMASRHEPAVSFQRK